MDWLSLYQFRLIDLVEATGVEPVSENISYLFSPGAVRLLEFPTPGGGGQPPGFGSFILHNAGKAYRVCVHH